MTYKFINFKSLVPYQEGINLQKIAFEKVLNKEVKGILLILEHEAVYTIGKDGGYDNLLESEETLKNKGIDVISVNRGGNITFHGEGQIVLYPIFDLSYLKKDIHLFINNLEEAIIKALHSYDIDAKQKAEYRGVWVNDQKIAAIGIHISKWISTHGIAININVDKTYFDLITPCGLREFKVCSLKDFKGEQNIEKMKEILIQKIESSFEIELEEVTEDFLKED